MPKRPIPLSRIRNPNVMPLSAIFPPAPPPEDDGEETLDAESNAANRQVVVDSWRLGPVKASIDPGANAPYWRDMAKVWDVDEATARTRYCANCEYYNNSPDKQAEMLAVPNDKFDADGGGRGFCVKFDFICHSLRVCQAWEEKAFVDPE